MNVTVDNDAHLDVPDDARLTREQLEDGAVVHRVFSGLVVMAVSAESLATADIGAVVAGLVGAYGDRPGFARSRLADIALADADQAYELTMAWQSDSGHAMRSIARVIGKGSTAYVLHAAYPAGVDEGLDAIARDLVGTLRWSTADAGG